MKRKTIRHILTIMAVLMAYTSSSQAQTVSTDTLTFRVHFPVGSSVLNPQFSNNADVLADVQAFHEFMEAHPDREVLSVNLFGSVSPEGPAALNERLAKERMRALLKKFDHSLRPHGNVTISYNTGKTIVGDGTVEAKVVMSAPDKSQYPALRYAEARFVITAPFVEKPAEPQPDPVSILPATIEHRPDAGVAVVMEGFEAAEEEPSDDKYLFVKTNGVAWCQLIANGAVEYQWSKHWSVSLPLYYSAVNYFTRFVKFRTITIQPELRYWFSGPNGFYVGVHPGIGWFNFATDGDYRYQDHDGRRPAVGGGVSAGYRFNLNKSGRWRMECTLGAGVYSASYDKFINQTNGPLVKSSIRKTWAGIDNAAVSVIYTFNIDKKK